jgi:1-acyl-sn-glycerol-3-phosphate acyltransferase
VKSHNIVGLRELARVDARPRPLVWWLTDKALALLQNTRVRVVLEGYPELCEPVLFAMNHSHYFDFMPSRRALWAERRVQTVGFVKARAYQNRLEAPYIKTIGNVPLISRGYLISADFAALHGRKPSEDEYRALREHVDHGAPLPDSSVFRALEGRARDMLDVPYEPAITSYREAIQQRYASGMAASVAQARAVLDAGVSLHIYPQGLYSTRLSRGRIGTVEFALALDVPIVPVGFSGMNECFRKQQMVPYRAGTLTMRFGRPRRVTRAELVDFRPFVPADEQRLREVLEDETRALMDEINTLLDPGYRFGEDLDGDGLEGVARFFD